MPHVHAAYKYPMLINVYAKIRTLFHFYVATCGEITVERAHIVLHLNIINNAFNSFLSSIIFNLARKFRYKPSGHQSTLNSTATVVSGLRIRFLNRKTTCLLFTPFIRRPLYHRHLLLSSPFALCGGFSTSDPVSP